MPFFGGGGGGAGGLYKFAGTDPAFNNISGGNASMLLVTGINNLALNNGALQNIEAGGNNIAIGAGAGGSITSGDSNTLIGNGAGGALTVHNYNTAIGDDCFQVNAGERNTVIGFSAMRDSTNCTNCIAIGVGAMDQSHDADYSVVISARYISDVQDFGVCIGSLVAAGTTLPVGAVGVGYDLAIGNNATDSVAIGRESRTGQTGAVSVGAYADGFFEKTVTIGYDSRTDDIYAVAVGAEATSGGSGVALGYSADSVGAGVALGTGANATALSVAIGANATAQSTGIAIGRTANASGAKSIAIGYEITAAINEIKIGDSSHTGQVSVGPYDLRYLDASAVTWATLPAAASVPVGTRRFVTDVGVGGSFWYSDGVRWRSVSRYLPLHLVAPVEAGQLFDVGTAEALFGGTTLIPGGVLNVGDNLRWVSAFRNPTIDTSARNVRIREALTSGGVLTGNVVLMFNASSGVNNNNFTDKIGTYLTDTKLRSVANSQLSVTSTPTSQAIVTIDSITSDFYVGCCVEPGTGTSILMYSCSLFAEFAS